VVPGVSSFEVLEPGGRRRNDLTTARLVVALDQPTVVRVLPNREPRARGSPRLEDLDIRTRRVAEPFEKIEDQSFDGVTCGNSRKLGHLHMKPHLDLAVRRTLIVRC
jgi:hypothetical protein